MADLEMTMVQRVGETIFEFRATRRDAFLLAREVIKAMREPTAEMARAGAGAMLESGEDSVPAWQAMIDAALDDAS